MDISHGGAPAAVAAKDVLGLTAATSIVIGTGMAGHRLIGLMILRTSDQSTFARSGGWQLYALAAVFGVAVLALCVSAVASVRRRYRELRETPHRRVAVLIAILPGLLLGLVGGLPLKPVLSWASDHTGAAAHERALERRMAAEYRAGPPTVSYRGVDAGDPLVVRLLDPRALGPDWHARYDTTAVGAPPPAPGVTRTVRVVLHQQHWSTGSWHSDMIVMEEVMTFRSAHDASAFSTTWLRQREPSSITTRIVAGVPVNVETVHAAGYPVYHHAEFAHGRYAVLLYPFADLAPASKAARFPSLLQTAVARLT